MWQALTIVIVGLWLALAPFFAMDIQSVKVNNVLIGTIVALAGWYLPDKESWKRWLVIIIGIWMLLVGATPWFAEGNTYIYNNVISGIVIAFSGFSLVVRTSFKRAAKGNS